MTIEQREVGAQLLTGGREVRTRILLVRKSRRRELEKEAKLTSKGQITVPLAIRRVLGVEPGDLLLFESRKDGVRVRPVSAESRFAKYRGIGNRGIGSGRKAIRRWVRETRGR